MLYKSFHGLKLSCLGMGAMRFPTVDGEVDEVKTAEMLDYCMANGVNYYDTAWGYHDGKSELILGRLLGKYPRDSYYLATKFPGFNRENMDNAPAIFARQLEKCQTTYFDFYLLHSVVESNIDDYLDPTCGVMPYLLEQKRLGRIRHLGFSTHGSLETMKRFLDAYGEHLEFCQIQLNYLDWTYQDAKAKVELISSYGLPVWVMEPVRGGRLATLPAIATRKLQALRPEETVPGWAFRFIQSIPEVCMTLSGMSSLRQVRENIATFSEEKPLNETEIQTLLDIAKGVLGGALPCTACRYCTAGCPQELNIPELLEKFNEHCFTGSLSPDALAQIPAEKGPAACVGCRSCEAVCPQKIKISEAMASFAEKLK